MQPPNGAKTQLQRRPSGCAGVVLLLDSAVVITSNFFQPPRTHAMPFLAYSTGYSCWICVREEVTKQANSSVCEASVVRCVRCHSCKTTE